MKGQPPHDARSEEESQELAELRRAYLDSLREAIAGLHRHWDQARGNPENAKALEALNIAVHRLAGSAALYDYPAISRQARLVEAELRAVRDESAPLGDTLHQGLNALLEEMQRTVGGGP